MNPDPGLGRRQQARQERQAILLRRQGDQFLELVHDHEQPVDAEGLAGPSKRHFDREVAARPALDQSRSVRLARRVAGLGVPHGLQGDRQVEEGILAGPEHDHVPRPPRRRLAPQPGQQPGPHHRRLAAARGTDDGHQRARQHLVQEPLLRLVHQPIPAEEQRRILFAEGVEAPVGTDRGRSRGRGRLSGRRGAPHSPHDGVQRVGVIQSAPEVGVGVQQQEAAVIVRLTPGQEDGDDGEGRLPLVWRSSARAISRRCQPPSPFGPRKTTTPRTRPIACSNGSNQLSPRPRLSRS